MDTPRGQPAWKDAMRAIWGAAIRLSLLMIVVGMYGVGWAAFQHPAP
ncbi:MAG: hypothetical protein ACXVQS_06645 [Actinomycetota bacterium]